MKTQDYTVVGLYKDNKQVWVGFINARTPVGAMKGAKAEVMDESGLEIAVLAVFEGEHKDLYGEDELYEE